MNKLRTPYFIFNEVTILDHSSFINRLSNRYNIEISYSLKSLECMEVLQTMATKISSFSASSLFEAYLARSILGSSGKVHFVSPGIRPDEIQALDSVCSHICFNSIGQWIRFSQDQSRSPSNTSYGLRVNPGLSFVKNDKYNPCVKYSKLGTPLKQLVDVLQNDASKLDGLEGIHFHTNSESSTFEPLLETVKLLDQKIPDLLSRLKWINLGGGYYFTEDMDYSPFEEAIGILKNQYGLEIFCEPGASVVQDAGVLVSEVIDIFESDGKQIVVLDTTVNHLPEVFEYGYRPILEGATPSGQHEYRFVGCSCLAGDIFGDYKLDTPLSLGDRIVFQYVGSYSLVKAHMFNGINLPDIHYQRKDGNLELLKRYTYDDFLDRCGVAVSESIRKRA